MKPEGGKEIDNLFAAALEREPAERTAFLDEACAGDEQLRKEIESLLAKNIAESLLGSYAVQEATLLLEKRAEELTSDRIGRYQVIRLLGLGAMGRVYLGVDDQLNRPVAVKLLSNYGVGEEESMRRFRQEALAASALNHPNILTIYEIGEFEDTPFITAEFVDGLTLRARMKAEALPIDQALDIAIQIAGALVAAHAAGIVHRDIKPENVMLRSDGLVKVLDFGIAKITQAEDDEKKNVVETMPGRIIGTAAYMSPEQARGGLIDSRSDIWSLGVVLYEMLTGEQPFNGGTVSDSIALILSSAVVPPSNFNPEVRPELDTIVAKALGKKREERYQNAKALLGDLRELRKRLDLNVELQRTKYGLTPSKGAFSEQSGAADGFALQIPSAGDIPNAVARALNSIAVLPFSNISADAENEYFCDGLAEELLNALARIEDLKVAAQTSAFSFKSKNADIREIGRALSVNTILQGSVRKSHNRLRITVQLINVADGYHLWSERYDREMKDIFDVQDEITLAVMDALRVKLLGEEKATVLKRYTENAEAYQLYLKGRYFWLKAVPGEFRKSRDYFQQAVDADPSYALGYCGLAGFYGLAAAVGIFPPNEWWPRAEAALKKALELDDTLAEVHMLLAALKTVYYRDWVGAETEFRRAFELNPKLAEVHNIYSTYLVVRGRLDEAIAEGQRTLELDPLSLRYTTDLGNWLYHARRYDEAIRQWREALELDPDNAKLYEAVGDGYEQKELHAEAIAAWQKAMKLAGDEELAAVLDNANAVGGFGDALRAVTQKRLERLNESSKRGEYVPSIKYASAYVRLGDKEQAFQWLEKACEERNVYPLLINSDPFYDSLRTDRRFQDLLRRVGLITN